MMPGAKSVYATDRAGDAALQRGFELHQGDWRDICLAIWDTMATDGKESLHTRFVTAAYVGPIRDGERWAICWRGRFLHVLYDPWQALIVGATDSGSSRPDVNGGAPQPRPPMSAEAVA
jgi:hypothetical protein